ncbi:MAG: TetR family transcriptional regulator [Ginsengibacter sp.]
MDKKEYILSVALELFGQKGFEGTSIRDIACKADVNIAMISYYFGSKEKMFQSIVENKASYLKEVFRELVNNTSLTEIEKIDLVIDHYVERIFAHPLFHHLLHRELSLNQRTQMHDRIIDILLRNIMVVKKIIESGIKNKIFRKVDPEITIATLIGTINQVLMSETMCRKLLQKDKDFKPYQSKKLKERIKVHLKQLMRAHLLLGNSNGE